MNRQMHYRILVAATALCLLGGCRHAEAPRTVLQPVTITEAQTEQTGQEGSSRYTGNVTAYSQVDIAFNEGGYVEQILQVHGQNGRMRPLQEGDSVREGTVLAQVRRGDYIARVQQALAQQSQGAAGVALAQGGQAQAQAALELATAGLREAQASQEASTAQVEEARVMSRQAGQQIEATRIATTQAGQQRDETNAAIGQAQAGVEEAQAALTRARQDFERVEKLYKSESLTKVDYDAARAAYDVGQARKQQAVQLLQQANVKLQEATSQIQAAQNRVAQAETQLSAAQTKISQAKAEAKARNSQISEGRARVAQAQSGLHSARAQVLAAQAAERGASAQLSAAQIPLGDTAVRAPMGGVVLARHVEQGTLVGPGSVAFTLADLTRMKIVFGVPDTRVKSLRQGQQASIHVDSLGQHSATGVITAISPAADPRTRVFNVELTVPNPQQHLKVGMIATLDLPGSSRIGGGALVPVASLIRSTEPEADYAVMVVTGKSDQSIAHLRTVRIGSVYGNQIAVQGVRPGEKIVTAGMNLVRDGEAVRVTGTPEDGGDGARE